MSEHYYRSHPMARKEHKCEMCYRMIRPGERYLRGSGMDGSSAWTWKECTHCEAFMARCQKKYGAYDEYSPDDLIEFEPDDLAELRVKVHYQKRWTDSRGILYPIPFRAAT